VPVAAGHFRCCVIDGVLTAGEGEQVQFRGTGAVTPDDVAAVQQQVRGRVLRWFARAGLEWLLCYWPRPPFTLQRPEQFAHGELVYHFYKPRPDGGFLASSSNY